MNIKQLEIFGFKSFKNKTVLEFNRSVIGIAGPNGCGKSNIVDALMWVMGETSPKSLRGSNFSDVIFNGTSHHPPSAFAEVSLLLEKGDQGFPERYNDFSELMITRRLERGGESEYFINRSPCRLKDIKEIFMDTGAGCRGFSIVEQEAVEKLITAKPRERRLIIEEVAGITKFRSRKEESLRKLDQVSRNLERLNDILKTQAGQLKHLSRQMKTAEKYRNLKKEIKDKEVELSFRTLKDMEEREHAAEKKLSACRKAQEELEVKKEEGKSQLSLMERELKDLETLLEKEKKYISELDFKIVEREKEGEKREAAAKIYQESLQNHNSSKESLGRDILESNKRIKDIERKLKELKTKKRKEAAELAAIQDSFKELEHLPDLMKRKEELGQEVQQHNREKNEWAVKTGILESRKGFLKREREKLFLGRQDVEGKMRKALEEKSERASWLEKHAQIQEGLVKDKESLLKNIQTYEEREKAFSKEVADLRQDHSLMSYKIEESRQLVNHFESPNEGTLSLLQWKPEEFQPLIKNITVEDGFETAVQVALDNHLYALLTEGKESLQTGLDYLKRNKKGKATFLCSPETPEKDRASEREKLQSFPAFICFLDEKISFSLEAEALYRLARRTAVVSNFYSALELKIQFPDFQFVTREGDFISRDHLIYGGSYENKTNIFKIKNKIQNLSEELTSKETLLTLRESELEQTTQALARLHPQMEDLLKKEKEVLNSIQSYEREEELMEKEFLRLEKEKGLFEKNQLSLEEEERQFGEEISLVERERREVEEVIQTKNNILSSLNERLENLKKLQVRKSQKGMDLFTTEKDMEMNRQEIELVRDFLRQSSGKKAGFLKTEESLKESIEREKRELEEINRECALYQEEKGQREKELAGREGKFEEKKADWLKCQQRVNEIEGEKEKRKQENYEVLLEKERELIKRQSLKEKLLKDYQLNFEKEVFVSKYESLSSADLEKDISSLKEKLDKIGGVNLIALKEYEALLKENLFLSEQREDLLNSKKELLKIISHVDKLCHKRFTDRLEEINFRFARVFPIVFQGEKGEARLVLHKEDGGEGEEGVDIMVRPPGKKLQNVSLLSRGEKALTAICLIYSLFLVKPSPFCVLDEIDAPLDDANNFRFLSVLRQMSLRSRVITITHNKRTMEACGCLYGVTMKEPGVSQIVSVDLGKPQTLSP